MTHPFTWLRCPHCAEPLTREQGSLRCPTRHTFDIARQGYVNLMSQPPPRNADTAAMLDARARFLDTGLFAPVADLIVDAVRGCTRIAEVGAGTGYYLSRVLDELPDARGLATDVSVAAAKRAARAHPRAAAIVADTWAGLPLADHSVDAVLCVFAPRNPAEFTRILAPGGRLVVAVPTSRHLRELRERHGLLGVADDKVDGIVAAFPGWTSQTHTAEYQVRLTAGQAGDLIAMGPNAFHRDTTAAQAEQATVSVCVVALHRGR